MIFIRLASATLRAQARYRASLLVDALSALAGNGLEFVALALTFDRFGSLAGWSMGQVAFLWGLTEIAFGSMDMLFGGFDPAVFGQHIRRGTLDMYLLRPVNLIAQIFASDIMLRRLGRIAQGALVFAYANHVLALAWTPAKLLYLPVVLVSAVLFYGALFIAGATASFWTVQGLEVVNVFTYGGTALNSYPLPIFDRWLRRFFTFVIPTAVVVYYPALYFFDLPDPLGLPGWVSFLAPAVGLGALGVSLLVFKWGLRHYTSTGA